MENQIKNGKEILDEFFKEIMENEELDRDTTQKIFELYENNSLSDKNLTNALEELRANKEESDGKNK